MASSVFERVFCVVLDSVGCGWLPDASAYGDAGANTILHTLSVEGRKLPHLRRMGLGNVLSMCASDAADAGGDVLCRHAASIRAELCRRALAPVERPSAVWGRMAEASPGKDTTTGHWELMGLILEKPFPTYPDGFPPEVIEPFQEKIGRKILGNKPASGTAIIEELGARHMETGRPIVYTSADSVFQIACHEEVVHVEELYEMCRIARSILTGEHAVSRVIARPFVGRPGAFVRTPRRHDFSLPPTGRTFLDALSEAGVEVYGIGKIHDIFAGRGVAHTVSTESNEDGMRRLLAHAEQVERGFVFLNLVDFDMKYGHRNDPRGYADALAEFDSFLGRFIPLLGGSDLLVITADHGCDPLFPGTDHTREHVPVLMYSPSLEARCVGTRGSYADLAATLGRTMGVEWTESGISMLE